MLSKLVTGGSTVVSLGGARFFGASLTTGAFTLTIHDAAATASAAAANEQYRMVHVASQPSKLDMPGAADGGNGIGLIDGLVTVLTAGGTATILYG